ncbi:MAG: hypothetical protein JNG88_02655 [Phycisphaerales bacterium]|nr:hypothetical protein [Phycisphaerales bacterium]
MIFRCRAGSSVATFLLLVYTALQSAADPIYDRACINDHCFVRSTFLPSTFAWVIDSFVAADSGIGVVAFEYGESKGATYGYFTHFDAWGNMLHQPVLIDEEHGFRLNHLYAARLQDVTVLLWQAPFTNGSHYLRFFDTSGNALTDAIYVLTSNATPGQWWVSAGPDRATATVLANRGSGQVVHVRSFNCAGDPIEPNAQLDAMYGDADFPRTAVATNGDLLLTYKSGPDYPTQYAVFERFSGADGTRLVQTAIARATSSWMIWEMQDASIAIGYGSSVEGQHHIFVQRLDTDGVPTEGRLDLGTDGAYIGTGLRDGRFAYVFDASRVVWVHLFDEDWNSLGPALEVQTPLLDSSEQTGLFVRNELAYEENGTVWLTWYTWGGPDANIWTATLQPFLPGDMNRDGLLNNFDIDPFVFALSNLPAYAATFNIPEDAAVIIGDINEDGFLNNFDIDPFVECLTGGGCQ